MKLSFKQTPILQASFRNLRQNQTALAVKSSFEPNTPKSFSFLITFPLLQLTPPSVLNLFLLSSSFLNSKFALIFSLLLGGSISELWPDCSFKGLTSALPIKKIGLLLSISPLSPAKSSWLNFFSKMALNLIMLMLWVGMHFIYFIYFIYFFIFHLLYFFYSFISNLFIILICLFVF